MRLSPAASGLHIGARNSHISSMAESTHTDIEAPEGFWRKIARYGGKVPFAEDAIAAWYCVKDPTTPHRVRAILAGALAYFVTPADLIPDILALVGFTDDAAVLALAIRSVSGAIRDDHRELARAVIQRNKRPAKAVGSEESAAQ